MLANVNRRNGTIIGGHWVINMPVNIPPTAGQQWDVSQPYATAQRLLTMQNAPQPVPARPNLTLPSQNPPPMQPSTITHGHQFLVPYGVQYQTAVPANMGPLMSTSGLIHLPNGMYAQFPTPVPAQHYTAQNQNTYSQPVYQGSQSNFGQGMQQYGGGYWLGSSAAAAKGGYGALGSREREWWNAAQVFNQAIEDEESTYTGYPENDMGVAGGYGSTAFHGRPEIQSQANERPILDVTDALDEVDGSDAEVYDAPDELDEMTASRQKKSKAFERKMKHRASRKAAETKPRNQRASKSEPKPRKRASTTKSTKQPGRGKGSAAGRTKANRARSKLSEDLLALVPDDVHALSDIDPDIGTIQPEAVSAAAPANISNFDHSNCTQPDAPNANAADQFSETEPADRAFFRAFPIHFKDNRAIVESFNKLCSAFNNKEIMEQEFMVKLYRLIYPTESVEMLRKLKEFIPQSWKQTEMNWLHEQIDKDVENVMVGRSVAPPKKKKRPVNGFRAGEATNIPENGPKKKGTAGSAVASSAKFPKRKVVRAGDETETPLSAAELAFRR